jgi:hypothetical protein
MGKGMNTKKPPFLIWRVFVGENASRTLPVLGKSPCVFDCSPNIDGKGFLVLLEERFNIASITLSAVTIKQ